MKNLSKILFLILPLMVLFQDCSKNVVNVKFTEKEMKWLPYDTLNSLIFKDSLDNLDTVFVEQSIFNMVVMCEFLCSGTIYQPVSGYIHFYNDSVFKISLSLIKEKPNSSCIGRFEFDYGQSVKRIDIRNYDTIERVLVENIYYDSVYVYPIDTVCGISKFYYKPGTGFIKFTGIDNKEWNLKKIL